MDSWTQIASSESGKTALIFAEIYRHDSEWKFAAVGTLLQIPDYPNSRGVISNGHSAVKLRTNILNN
jgi:hypothetical protein